MANGTVATLPNGVTTISNADYHADHGALSSSGAKKLLPPSCPALYKWEQDHPVYKDAFDLGNAAHALVLHDGSIELDLYQAADWRTKAAREFKKEAREAGRVPLLPHELDNVKAMADVIISHPEASRLLAEGSGKPEQSLKWVDERTGVNRRARLDFLPDPVDGKRMMVSDYKTSKCAEPEQFAATAMRLGYHMQAAWYQEAVIACGLDPDPLFLFIVQETEAPYLVSVIELDFEALAIGRHLNDKALDVYKECTETGVWPSYGSGVELVSLPNYYTKKFEGELI